MRAVMKKKEIVHTNVTVGDNGHLYFAGKDTTVLAEKYGTPAYILDEGRVRERVNEYKSAMKEYFGGASMPLFASKALSFKEIYRIMASEGIGTDIVSAGELYTAAEAGFPMERGFFHGNNKTDADIEYAISRGLGYFVVDNFEELDAVAAAAAKAGITQKILLRITPGIDPHTHQKISTGGVDSKFGSAIETGLAEEITKAALEKKNITLCGFHCHVGSQIFDTEPFTLAADIMLDFIADMRDKLGYTAEILNLGGGFGVRYLESDPEISITDNIRDISLHVKAKCAERGLDIPTIYMEPGRSLVADAGITLYTVGSVKEIKGFKNYVSIDGGMTDNPRYTLYQSPYTVVNASDAASAPDLECTVGGRCCESGDLIQENVKIKRPERGDVLAVLVTGAYNHSMSSNYNRVARPPVVVIRENGDEFVAVRRETFADVAARDM